MSRIFSLLVSALSGMCSSLFAEVPHWIVYYNNQATYDQLSGYDPVVLDSEGHPPLTPFVVNDKTTLGYISLGEVSKDRYYFDEVKADGVVLKENPHWPGNFFVDLRSPKWTKRVIEQMIPFVLFQRFSGLFLDTIDDAVFLENEDPVKYKGMRDAAIKLVKTIRLNFPRIPIMMNRGLDLVPDVATDINMLLAESTFAYFNTKTNKYERLPEEEYQDYVKRLKGFARKDKDFVIYTLDYWDPSDPEGIKVIYRVQRDNGFIPYVSTRDLQNIVPEPN